MRNNVFSRRIHLSGSDELAEMALLVNSLFDMVEMTEEELKLRITHRSDRLEHLSDLNKNLFNEINRQRGIGEKLREQEKNLRRFAYYDQLTGLPNRMFFREQVKKIIERAVRSGVGLVIMFLDTDRFKRINDTYGHDVGDEVLKEVATRLKNTLRSKDIIARLGGDEFALALTPNADHSISLVAERVLAAFDTPMQIKGNSLNVFASVGICVFPNNGKTIEQLIKKADLAMYKAKKIAKQKNRGAFVVWEENL